MVNSVAQGREGDEADTTLPDEQGQTFRLVDSVDEPPDGGYGWVIVGAVFLINFHTWGLNSSYGVFLAHYLANNTYPGATSLDYAFVGGLSISTALLVSPLATVCTRRFGTKASLSIGVALECIGLLGASWATEIWHLFMGEAVSFGLGMGFLFVPSVGIVPQWFTTKRSFANSIAAAGSGIGGLVYSLSSNAMIERISVAWAFRILAILALVVNTICIVLIRDRNKAVGAIQIAFDVRLFKRPEFLLFLGWGFFSMLGYIVLLFSLPNYARSVGLSAQQGSVIGAMLNLGQGIGRPFVGYFSDAVGRLNIAAVFTFLAGFFCLVFWTFAKKYGILIFFAIVVGTTSGTFWATVGPVGSEVMGLPMLPTALSITWLVLVVPCTFSEPIGLELRASTGNIYLHAQLFTGFMYIAAAICMYFLRAWKIAELGTKTASEVKKTEGRNSGAAASPDTKDRALDLRSLREVARVFWVWQRV